MPRDERSTATAPTLEDPATTMAYIDWVPARPADTVFASRVEQIVYSTIGSDATGKLTLVVENGGIRVPPARIVPSPRVWDTCGEPIRVDDGIVEALRLAGIVAR